MLICTGPSGTGKTMEACKAGLSFLQENRVDKLIITRPNVTVEESLGYLPGDMEGEDVSVDDTIYEYLEEFSDKKTGVWYLRDGIVEVCPLGYMQGRTFNDTFIIADEVPTAHPVK